MERVSDLETEYSQRPLAALDSFGNTVIGLAKSTLMLIWKFPRICRKLPTLRRFYSALRAGTRLELPVEGDGLCWAYALAAPRINAVVVFNRSPHPIQRRIGVSSLGLRDGRTLKELVGDKEVEVVSGTARIYLSGCAVRVFISVPEPGQQSSLKEIRSH